MGKVYLVGAGPGDPELLTVRAVRVLRQADVVLYDRLVSPAVLELAPRALRVYVGKEAGAGGAGQAEILQRLREYALRYPVVVRLKGGDPMVFGRGGEEWAYLRAQGIPVELVPGVTSAVAVPGRAGIPLTFRGVARSFAVVTGHCGGGEGVDWARLAGADTLVILMGVRRRAAIARALLEAGRPPGEPVAFVERGTWPEERVVAGTLAQVAEGRLEVEAPAVWVVGPVVALRPLLQGEPHPPAAVAAAAAGGR